MKSKILFLLLLIVLSCGEGPGGAEDAGSVSNVLSKCRLIKYEVSTGFTITYEYDNDGRLIKRTTDSPDSFERSYTYEYDVFGNPKSILEKWESNTESKTTFTYGLDSLITEGTLVYYNPAATKYWDYTYNNDGQLTRIDGSAVQCAEEYYEYEYTGDNITESSNVCGATWQTVTHSDFDSKINFNLLLLKALNNRVGALHFGVGKNNARTRVRETSEGIRTETIEYTYNDDGLPTHFVSTTTGVGIVEPIVLEVTLTYDCD